MGKQYSTGYPSDVSDEEWGFVAGYLALCREDAGQREHSLRAVFNGLRYIVRTATSGALCQAICRHGRSFTSRRSVGYAPDALR